MNLTREPLVGEATGAKALERINILLSRAAIWGLAKHYVTTQPGYEACKNATAELKQLRILTDSDTSVISFLVAKRFWEGGPDWTVRQLSIELEPGCENRQRTMAKKIKRVAEATERMGFLQTYEDVHEVTGQACFRIRALGGLFDFLESTLFREISH